MRYLVTITVRVQAADPSTALQRINEAIEKGDPTPQKVMEMAIVECGKIAREAGR